MKIFEIINRNLNSSLNVSLFRKKVADNKGSVITISREKGAGGRIIAAKLAKKLGGNWDYYHREIVDKIAEETKVTPENVKRVDEKEIPYLEGIFGSWVGQEYLSLTRYTRTLLRVLADLGNRGNVILVGRGANFLFKDALKVRIIADYDQRVASLMKYEKFTKKEAEDRIRKSDANRKNFVKNLFGEDLEEARHYDLILKTGPHLSIDDAVSGIAKLAKKRFKF